jgi:hypothetical protein
MEYCQVDFPCTFVLHGIVFLVRAATCSNDNTNTGVRNGYGLHCTPTGEYKQAWGLSPLILVV